MSLKAEAQKQVSVLEGKVGELIHVNSSTPRPIDCTDQGK